MWVDLCIVCKLMIDEKKAKSRAFVEVSWFFLSRNLEAYLTPKDLNDFDLKFARRSKSSRLLSA